MTSSNDTAEFYQARSRLRKGGWFVIEGKSLAVKYALEDGYRGDFARWALEQELRKWVRARRWWKRTPPPWVARSERPPTTFEEAAALLLAVYACWRATTRK